MFIANCFYVALTKLHANTFQLYCYYCFIYIFFVAILVLLIKWNKSKEDSIGLNGRTQWVKKKSEQKKLEIKELLMSKTYWNNALLILSSTKYRSNSRSLWKLNKILFFSLFERQQWSSKGFTVNEQRSKPKGST